MAKFIKTFRYVVSGAIAIFVFFGWVSLVGPQIHVVETVIGLVMALCTFGYVMHLTRKGNKAAEQNSEGSQHP